MNRIAVLTGVALTLAAGHATAASFMSWQGKWKLDMEKTHYPPMIPVTSNDLEVTKDDAISLQYSGKIVLAGKEITAAYKGTWDGRPHDAGNGQTLAYEHVSNNKFKSVRKTADGAVAERSTCTFAPGGKALTCHIELAMPDGKTVTFDEYFDRVS